MARLAIVRGTGTSHFVAVRSTDEHSKAVVLRAQLGVVRRRRLLVNAVRFYRAEFRSAAAQGTADLKHTLGLMADGTIEFREIVEEIVRLCLDQANFSRI